MCFEDPALNNTTRNNKSRCVGADLFRMILLAPASRWLAS